MFKWIVSIAAVAALAVPAMSFADSAPAAGNGTQLDGSAVALQGRLLLRADLTAASGSGPVQLAARMGFVRFVDLGGDMKAQCNGKGPDRTTQNDQGQTVVMCAGRGRATVTGSHVRIAVLALRYGISIPDGYSGTVKGRVRPWDGNDDSLAQQGDAASAAQSDGQKAVSTIDAALASALAGK